MVAWIRFMKRCRGQAVPGTLLGPCRVDVINPRTRSIGCARKVILEYVVLARGFHRPNLTITARQPSEVFARAFPAAAHLVLCQLNNLLARLELVMRVCWIGVDGATRTLGTHLGREYHPLRLNGTELVLSYPVDIARLQGKRSPFED